MLNDFKDFTKMMYHRDWYLDTPIRKIYLTTLQLLSFMVESFGATYIRCTRTYCVPFAMKGKVARLFAMHYFFVVIVKNKK